MPRPIKLALVWHMHQPYYKDDLTSTYLLPWVRLHCAKDYLKMLNLLEGYPKLKQTFNLVPSLLAQIDDYGRGEAQDLFLNLCSRPAAELTAEERSFLVRWIRESPQALRVQQSPRYLELASREAAPDSFTDEEVRDLQVWSNLAWFDPARIESDPDLAALKVKDREFSEADKGIVFDAQLAMVRDVIPRYRQMVEAGRIELTTSPYYHPILPLVVDGQSARAASPGIELPSRPFAHPEDAEQQIALGIATFEKLVGVRPHGMWPSEMAVSDAAAGLAAEAGVEWLISDEDVLARSLDHSFVRDAEGRVNAPDLLYMPHRLQIGDREVSLVFRDKVLSNLIGFDYYRMPALDAARDFVGRLRRIKDMQGDDRDFLVTVALDGENAWEFYPRDGHDFLNALYTELSEADDIVCTKIGPYLAEHQQRRSLPRLHPGSWINASYDTWIGDPEHTDAWEMLAETRDWLEEFGRHHPQRHQQLAAAWREIMITEGSDWYWWFSRRHDSGMDAIWDNQFRLHLRNVYKVLEEKPPSHLFEPIIRREEVPNVQRPVAEFTPRGADDPNWKLAGRYEVSTGFGALHRPSGLAERVFYAVDDESLYIKVESSRTLRELSETGVRFWLYLSGPPLSDWERGQLSARLPMPRVSAGDLGFVPGFAASIRFDPTSCWLEVIRIGEDWRSYGPPLLEMEVPHDSALTFAVPFNVLQKSGGEPLELALAVVRDGTELERVPPAGALGLRVPGIAHGAAQEPLKILLAASEVFPFAKTGGLADVAAALPKELRRLGHDVRIVMPRYRQISREFYGLAPVVPELAVPLGAQDISCSILEGRLGEVPVYFVDCPQLYDRDSIYGFGDDDARFIYFDRALIEMLQPLGWVPDVIHCHDWHTALVPNLLEILYAPARPELANVATVLTIHNLAFQGVFGFGSLHLAGLDQWGLIRVGVPHLDDVVNLLGRGIHFADIVNTVSERYAEEIQTAEFGEGLEALLARHSPKLHGVVNGIDVEAFDPATDPAVPHHYTAADPSSKRLDKDALRNVLGLEKSDMPVIALISRLYDQKGLDIISPALPAIAAQDVQLAVLGTGERRYEDMFRYQAAQHPGRISASIGFDHHLAQLMYAGADMILMASRFEPCGLGQLIGMRYGTIPVVRATGGLVDTVADYDPRADTGVGFVFEEYDPWALFGAVVRAAEAYRHGEDWERLVRRAMAQDVSWARSAQRYVELYRTALVSNRDRRGVVPASLIS